MSLEEKNSPSEDEERLLARLVVKGRILSSEKMNEVLSFQQEERTRGRNVSLERLLLDSCLVTETQLDSLRFARTFLLKRDLDRVFGRILSKVGYACQEEIDLALLEQQRIFKEKQFFKSILDILLESGAITSKKKDAVVRAAEKLQRIRPQEAPAVHAGAKKTEKSETPEVRVVPGEASPEVRKSDVSLERIRRDPGVLVFQDEVFDVLVPSDKLEAYVALKGEIPEGMDAAAVKVILQAHGIHGLAGEEVIDACLRESGTNRGIFKVAQGIPPRKGEPSSVKYHFRPRPKWDELVESKTTLDFKDRGEIPQVSKGFLLAEKTPMVDEDPGMSVLGEPFPVEKVQDVKLLVGAGAELSPDGLKAFAAVDGRPELSPFGKLSVFPELKIDGDVDFETGNIEFNGHIIVAGIVQDGFRVKGGALTAREISKAVVEVSGEVVARGGVLGAQIKAEGGVRAFHLHAAQVEALGDVIVDRGIVDSKIVTAGKCIVRGTILASVVSARLGMEVAQIGSSRSGPCTVVFGVDPATEREIEMRRQHIRELEKERAEAGTEVRRLREQYAKIERSAGTLVQLQDRSLREQRALSDELKKWKEAGNQAEASRVERTIKDLTSTMKSRDADLDVFLNRQDMVREKVSVCQTRMKEIAKEVQGLKEEIVAFSQWLKERKDTPCIRVSGLMSAGTAIRGPNTSMRLGHDCKGVLVKEVAVTTEEGRSAAAFELKISNLY